MKKWFGLFAMFLSCYSMANENFVAQMKKQLPLKINNEIVWNDIYLEGKTIVFSYRFTSLYDVSAWRETLYVEGKTISMGEILTRSYKEMVREQNCSIPRTQWEIKNKPTYKYIYFSANNHYVMDFTLNYQRDCR